jgi:DNA-binding transcriptional LysR family regulator
VNRVRTITGVLPELRQMRYFVEVVRERNFTRAAGNLHVAQQALSQQVKALERGLGVTLLERTTRSVEPTEAGIVFAREAERLLAAAQRAVDRTRDAADGEAGTVRLAYTFSGAPDTVPVLVAAVHAQLPRLKVKAQEVFAADLPELLLEQRFDCGIAPAFTDLPADLDRMPLRVERMVAALPAAHALATGGPVELPRLRDELFLVWPRTMAPGFHDAVLAACRAAGFDPRTDELGAGGSTAWGRIARGEGVVLTVASNRDAMQRGIVIAEVAPPVPTMTIDTIWRHDLALPAMQRFCDLARDTARANGWIREPAGA